MKEKLIDAFMGLVNSTISAVPKVLVGLVMVAVAFVVAKVIERSLRFALTRVKFDDLVDKAGVGGSLQRLGVSQALSLVIPRLVYYLILLLLARTAADAFGLEAISNAIGAFFSYLPNIAAALLLIVLGSSVARFAGQTVTQAAANSGLDFAPALGRLVSGVILFVSAMMALSQLKVETDIVRIVTSFVLAGGALAFGLSFGLGTREVVRNIAAGFYARKVLGIGRTLSVAGQEGTVRAITATHVVLESGDQELLVANATVLEQAARQSSPAK